MHCRCNYEWTVMVIAFHWIINATLGDGGQKGICNSFFSSPLLVRLLHARVFGLSRNRVGCRYHPVCDLSVTNALFGWFSTSEIRILAMSWISQGIWISTIEYFWIFTCVFGLKPFEFWLKISNVWTYMQRVSWSSGAWTHTVCFMYFSFNPPVSSDVFHVSRLICMSYGRQYAFACIFSPPTTN